MTTINQLLSLIEMSGLAGNDEIALRVGEIVVSMESCSFHEMNGRTALLIQGGRRAGLETRAAPSEVLRDSAENFAREMTLDVHGPDASETDMRRVSSIVCESMTPSPKRFNRPCSRCGDPVYSSQPITATVVYCSLECAD